jgi:hypothetical protein
MKDLKRAVFGLAFTVAIAVSLLASGGDAYAKTRTSGATSPSSPTLPAPGIINTLGVTWED